MILHFVKFANTELKVADISKKSFIKLGYLLQNTKQFISKYLAI